MLSLEEESVAEGRPINEELAAEVARLKARLREVEVFEADRAEHGGSLPDDTRLLTQVIDAVEDGISVLDARLRILRVNRRMDQWYAHATPLAGKLCYEAYHGRSEPCEVCPSRLAIERKSHQVAEVPLTTPQGVVGTLELHAYPILDGDNEVTAVVEIVRDASARARAEEERRHVLARMLQAQKLESLGVLAGGIAHDFNNLLTAILGNADLAQAETSPASPAHQHLRDIESSARRGAGLARQMLAYAGRGHFAGEPIELSAAVRETEHLVAAFVPKRITLTFNLARRLPPVAGDLLQLKQVLMSLVTNASEAIGPDSGGVTVSTGMLRCDREYLREVFVDEGLPEGRYVFIEVTDTGHGFDSETRARLFDPFFTTKFTGRGLGLAAAFGIVRGHKGAIEVTSEVGRGSTFRVLLPALDSEPASALAREEGVGAWPGAGCVLFVDDEEDLRRVGRRMLQKLGFDALLAADGREAVGLLERHADEVVAVVLDLTMSGQDDEATLGQLRRVKADVPVILSSAFDEHDVARRFAGLAPDGFVQKPYRIADLKARLREVVGRGSARGPRSGGGG